MKDKFKAMVERAVENGFKFLKSGEDVDTINISAPDGDEETTTIDGYTAEMSFKGDEYIFHLSDLLFNHEFMRALVAGKCTHFIGVDCTAERTCTFSESCETCEYYSPINAMLEAAQLPTDQQRIDYVHGLIKGESE